MSSAKRSAADVAAKMGIAEGVILAGKYRVARVIGKGGMGLVVEAEHVGLRERVALKVLLPEQAEDSEASSRFFREARAAAKMRGEHVARVSDVGELSGGLPYMVMEYLEGVDLATRLKKTGPFSVVDAVDFALQGCEALVEAHGLGIVHRDIKPANLFLTARNDGTPQIKLLDFGISKSREDDNDGLTRTATAMGSALYMSPEQMRETKSVDHRTDVYSMGITLHELLAGKPPFYSEKVAELCALVLTGTPEPLKARRPEVDDALAEVVARAYRRDAAQRYASVVELVAALAPHAPLRSQSTLDRVMRMANLAGVTAGTARATSPRALSTAPAQSAQAAALRPSPGASPPVAAAPSSSRGPALAPDAGRAPGAQALGPATMELERPLPPPAHAPGFAAALASGGLPFVSPAPATPFAGPPTTAPGAVQGAARSAAPSPLRVSSPLPSHVPAFAAAGPVATPPSARPGGSSGSAPMQQQAVATGYPSAPAQAAPYAALARPAASLQGPAAYPPASHVAPLRPGQAAPPIVAAESSTSSTFGPVRIEPRPSAGASAPAARIAVALALVVGFVLVGVAAAWALLRRTGSTGDAAATAAASSAPGSAQAPAVAASVAPVEPSATASSGAPAVVSSSSPIASSTAVASAVAPGASSAPPSVPAGSLTTSQPPPSPGSAGPPAVPKPLPLQGGRSASRPSKPGAPVIVIQER